MSIHFRRVRFEFPNGKEVFSGLDCQFQSNVKYGVVGANGIGKSVLGRLIAGLDVPSEGDIVRNTMVTYLSQSEDPSGQTVGEYLLEVWGSTEQAVVEFRNFALNNIDLSCRCGFLSAGQWMKIRLLKCLSVANSILVLDEPSNHLDEDTKFYLAKVLSSKIGYVLISHDRQLLESVDKVVEISNLGLQMYGGNWSFYQIQKELDLERRTVRLAEARKILKQYQNQINKKIENKSRRVSRAKKFSVRTGMSKEEKRSKQERASVSIGKSGKNQSRSLDRLELKAIEAWQDNKIFKPIKGHKVLVQLNESKLILEIQNLNFVNSKGKSIWQSPLTISAFGSERIHLRGENGVGKSLLLRYLSGKSIYEYKVKGSAKFGQVSLLYLDQNHSLLDRNLSAIDNILKFNLDLKKDYVHSILSHFQFCFDQMYQPVQQLSGGELMRLSLAYNYFSKKPVELLVLDEPTNNLDIESIEFLESFLTQFNGALMIVCHDKQFISRINIDKEIHLISDEEFSK